MELAYGETGVVQNLRNWWRVNFLLH